MLLLNILQIYLQCSSYKEVVFMCLRERDFNAKVVIFEMFL
jgi:hypothetical protein